MGPISLAILLSTVATAISVSTGFARLRRKPLPEVTGLQTLVENQEAEVDIVCVHRLGDDSSRAWTTRAGTEGVNWLKTLLPQEKDIPKARVFTYGYTSDLGRSKYFQDTLYLQSSALLAQLVSKRPEPLQRRPIIFIAHGVGGIIVKNALIESSATIVEKDIGLKAIQLLTVGVLYFGTPHQPTQWTWDEVITRVVSMGLGSSDTSSTSLSQALAVQRDPLRLLFDRYKSIEAQIKNYIFSEGLKTQKALVGEFGKSEQIFVVPAQVGEPPSAGKWWIKETLGRNHADLVKFSDPKDADYQKVINSIKSCSEGFEKAQQRYDKFLKEIESLQHIEVLQKPQKKAKSRPKQPKQIEEPPIIPPSYPEAHGRPEIDPNYNAILIRYENSHGLCDPKTLEVLEKLAQTYFDKADYECAEMIYKRVFVAKQDLDGPLSLSVARILTRIASVAQEQGHFSEAAKCLRRAIAIDNIILSADDIETINTSASLADVYNSEGRLEEAKTVYDDVKGRKNFQRRVDEKTLEVLESSAENLRNLGKNEEAAATYTTVIERRRSRSDSSTDPLLASTVVKLADVYEDMGKVDDMRKVLERGPLPRMSSGTSHHSFDRR